MRSSALRLGVVAGVGVLAAMTAWPQAMPFVIGRSEPVLAPALNRGGSIVAFGASVSLAGEVRPVFDLYTVSGGAPRRLTQFADAELPSGVTEVSQAPDGTRIAFTVLRPKPDLPEEVHLIDTASGQDRVLATDKEGCIQPLALCVNCFFSCLHTPHLSVERGKVLYAASRERPFYTVNLDGTGLTRLPIYTGQLAPAPQRVVTRTGQVVFTSNAPSGPTFAASATDVYLTDLDGGPPRNLTGFGLAPQIFTSNAVISADGGVVVFEGNVDLAARKASPVTQIFVIRADGTGLTQLTSGPDAASSPSLSADGAFVAYVQNQQVLVAPTFGKGPVRVLAKYEWSTVRDPVWSDDGSRVAFTIGPPNGGRGAVLAAAPAGDKPVAVYAPRSINPQGATGLVGYESPSAGSFANVYGTNFADDQLTLAHELPLPLNLGGVSVLVNGAPVPLFAVTPWQITAQLPQTLPDAPATFVVRVNDVSSAGAQVRLRRIAPAYFLLPTNIDSGFYWQAAAFHAGTGTPANRDRPARAGEALEIYASGLGMTEPLVSGGSPSPVPPARTVVEPRILVGGQAARVIFAGLVPGLVGIYQVNAIVPEGLTPGSHPLTLSAGEESFTQGLIWVR